MLSQDKNQFDVILADPPWPFRVWNKDTGHGRSAESHYPTMSIESLCDLGRLIRPLCAPNCALFLWAVWPSIFEYVPPVMAAWGFEYKTLAFEWIKINRSGVGWHMGMGYYTRANSEPCLLGIKRKMPVVDRGVRNLIVEYEDEIAGLPIIAPVRDHSRKPDEQYARIERMYPNVRCLELFARHTWPRWLGVGNAINGQSIETELKVLAELC